VRRRRRRRRDPDRRLVVPRHRARSTCTARAARRARLPLQRWGEKFEPWDADADVAARWTEHAGPPPRPSRSCSRADRSAWTARARRHDDAVPHAPRTATPT
jgi:hypothetical protein